ncbi:GNAT family N-acetyltransferase [Martelella endophytica]|uniref:GNAT family acetyltransferase n=1 Tax=Martelella endophytica TaxID=1486262 RepID=A0A0D5LMW5_MAREN|nr:GNAT family N-acetyltransferase [Martelella endophytica]AJY45471.1 GNAT family acetyltransferase [Martelella endophytica]
MATDMLVKLYELEPDASVAAKMAAENVTIRPALAPEMAAIAAWIEPRFGAGWVSEMQVSMARQPVSCLIAVREGELLGFACYDATARGFFGPTGVDETERGKGIGHALLIETLLAMRNVGYGYGVIGGAGPTGFYQKSVGAIPIADSDPGIYRGMLTAAHPSDISE